MTALIFSGNHLFFFIESALLPPPVPKLITTCQGKVRESFFKVSVSQERLMLAREKIYIWLKVRRKYFWSAKTDNFL